MSDNKRVNIVEVDPKQYDELYLERLFQSDIDEQQMLTLFVRTALENFEAYQVAVKVDSVKRGIGGAALRTVFVDVDMGCGTKRMNSILSETGDWSSPSMRVRRGGARVATPYGFFAPYQPDELDMFLLQATALDIPSLIDR